MKQTTFASTGFELVTKRTHKREFLEEMNLVVPWTELVTLKWTPDLRQQFKWDTVTRNGVNHDRDKKAQRTPAGAQSQGRA